MRVFVTGGDGFIGRHLLPRLLAAGHRVTALAGEPHSPAALRALGVTAIVPGRLEAPDAWLSALAGHDAVIHLAGPVQVWGPWRLFEQQMVEATRRLYQAAQRHGVPRFVFSSSETVHWGADVAALVDIDEDAPFSRRPYSHYSRAKQQVERFLQAATGPTQAVIVRLPFVWGPGTKFLRALQTHVQQGRFMWVGDRDMPLEAIHVDNAVAALLAALTRGQPGAAYLVTDEQPYTQAMFLGDIIRALGLPVPTRQAPVGLLRVWTAAAEGLWRVLPLPGSPQPMTRFELAFFTLPRRYRTARARRDLGYRPVVDWATGLQGLRASS